MNETYNNLKTLHNDLNHAHVNDISLKYNVNPVLLLAGICIVMFDKINNLEDKVNKLEDSVYEDSDIAFEREIAGA